jgi:hypothetical protein
MPFQAEYRLDERQQSTFTPYNFMLLTTATISYAIGARGSCALLCRRPKLPGYNYNTASGLQARRLHFNKVQQTNLLLQGYSGSMTGMVGMT